MKAEKVVAEVIHKDYVKSEVTGECTGTFEFMDKNGNYYRYSTATERPFSRGFVPLRRFELRCGGSYQAEGVSVGDTVILYRKIRDDGSYRITGWRKVDLSSLQVDATVDAAVEVLHSSLLLPEPGTTSP